jgi:uncharacterized LabA/DUF88 family protein
VLQSEFRGARIDLDLFARALSAEAQLLRSYYYDCPSFQSNPPTDDERLRYAAQRRFFEALNALPRFSVRLGRLERRGPDDQGVFTFEQKRVDILLGVDLVSLATKQAIQEAILVAGDSDFIPAIHASKNEGVMVKLIHGSTYHADLWKEADERIPITKELVDAVLREDP